VGSLWFGGTLEFVGGGSLEEASMGQSVNYDLNSTWAINALLEYQASDVIAIGLMPRYVFGSRVSVDSNTGDDSTMLDLRARVSAGGMIAPLVRAYGFGALGYSIIYAPSSVLGA
jgi:hypothetical protein